MTTTTKITWADANILYLHRIHDDIFQEYRPGREALGTGLGYIIHESDEGDIHDIPTYSITHLASGYRIMAIPVLTEELAKRLVIAFAPLTDWQKPMEKVTSDKKLASTIYETYKEIDTAYWSAIDEEREDSLY